MLLKHLLGLTAAVVLASGVVAAGPVSAQALKTAKLCNDEYAAQKQALKAAKETKKEFVSTCRTLPVGTATPIGSVAASPAPATPRTAPVPENAPSPVGTIKTAGACDDEYKANKGALKDVKEKKKDFIAACRALPPGTPTPIGTATTAPVPVPPQTSVPAPLPQQTAVPRPAPAPAPTRPPVQSPPATGDSGYAQTPSNPTSTQFASEAAAKGHCPSDTVVWVNTKSGVYHYAGQRNYAHTKTGAFECEADAKREGDRATKNGQ